MKKLITELSTRKKFKYNSLLIHIFPVSWFDLVVVVGRPVLAAAGLDLAPQVDSVLEQGRELPVADICYLHRQSFFL